VDPEERAFREREFALRQKELARARRFAYISAGIALLTVLFSAIAVIGSITSASSQARANDAQFRKNVRDTTYNNIVTGLGSASGAVQVNSMRLLAQYVRDRSNYDSVDRQQDGVVNAIQTLAAFIEDKSSVRSQGLTDYESPQPIVLSRAMTQLKQLVSDPDLGSHSTDISRANLHGISLPYLTPQGSLLAVATDFRRATLNNLNLSRSTSEPDLRASFFTCSVLTKARFGDANVSMADFSGADLSDADLSQVKELESRQMRGVTVTSKTRLPKGVTVSGPAWGVSSRKCADVADLMTGMISGQGYTSRIPCPLDTREWSDRLARRKFRGRLEDLIAVCTARAGG
jgi:hypothetical protein